MKFIRSIFTQFIFVGLTMSAGAAAFAAQPAQGTGPDQVAQVAVTEPLNIAILVQDDLVSRVGNELNVTRDFIRTLPAGSNVMVGYITAGTLQVRQKFTADLDKAAKSLRIPIGSSSASSFNPYVEVLEALQQFPAGSTRTNTVLLISDGLDTSRGFDAQSTIYSVDLEHAIREAKKRNVAIYSFFAPSATHSGHSYLATSYGQSALERLGKETGGRAFFQGFSFVTFDSYFSRLRRELNEQSLRAS